MRYEHIVLDISTAGAAKLLECLNAVPAFDRGTSQETIDHVENELSALRNELFARLQRRDVDPHCPKNVPTEDWLNT